MDGYCFSFKADDETEHVATGEELAISERSENQTAREKRIAARAYHQGMNRVYNQLIDWDTNEHKHHNHCVLCQAIYALGPHPSCDCHACVLDYQLGTEPRYEEQEWITTKQEPAARISDGKPVPMHSLRRRMRMVFYRISSYVVKYQQDSSEMVMKNLKNDIAKHFHVQSNEKELETLLLAACIGFIQQKTWKYTHVDLKCKKEVYSNFHIYIGIPGFNRDESLYDQLMNTGKRTDWREAYRLARELPDKNECPSWQKHQGEKTE